MVAKRQLVPVVLDQDGDPAPQGGRRGGVEAPVDLSGGRAADLRLHRRRLASAATLDAPATFGEFPLLLVDAENDLRHDLRDRPQERLVRLRREPGFVHLLDASAEPRIEDQCFPLLVGQIAPRFDVGVAGGGPATGVSLPVHARVHLVVPDQDAELVLGEELRQPRSADGLHLEEVLIVADMLVEDLVGIADGEDVTCREAVGGPGGAMDGGSVEDGHGSLSDLEID
ncbi:hypothetical protein [uncultured Aureimonas sp.]|uniref:hypothetical protein n=1 Tax=uncultured Aureimonas sp. TaxID=1604662 RepID=UPI0025F74AEE|nr:hypothetical protein [uncultured Aureimonas sp.]